MNKVNPENNNEESSVIRDLQEDGEKIIKSCRDGIEVGQYLCDISRTIEPIINYLGPEDKRDYINYLKLVHKQNRYSMPFIEKDIRILSGGTAVISTATVSLYTTGKLSTDNDYARNDLLRFTSMINLLSDETTVITLINSLDLNSAYSTKTETPISLLRIAFQAFKAPITDDNPVITSLIPLRSAMELIIAQLLKIPKQERTGNYRKK